MAVSATTGILAAGVANLNLALNNLNLTLRSAPFILRDGVVVITIMLPETAAVRINLSAASVSDAVNVEIVKAPPGMRAVRIAGLKIFVQRPLLQRPLLRHRHPHPPTAAFLNHRPTGLDGGVDRSVFRYERAQQFGYLW